MIIICFALDVEGVDVKRHGEIILEKGTAAENYIFASNVKCADISLHLKAIEEKGDYILFLFAKDILEREKELSENDVDFEEILNSYFNVKINMESEKTLVKARTI